MLQFQQHLFCWCFCTNDIMFHALWHHLSPLPYQFTIFEDVGGWQPWLRGRLSCTGLRWWRTKEPLLFWLGLGNRVLLCSLCSFVLWTLIISDPVYETPPGDLAIPRGWLWVFKKVAYTVKGSQVYIQLVSNHVSSTTVHFNSRNPLCSGNLHAFYILILLWSRIWDFFYLAVSVL